MRSLLKWLTIAFLLVGCTITPTPIATQVPTAVPTPVGVADCIQPVNNSLVFTPVGELSTYVTFAVYNCGEHAWEQPEFRLAEGDPKIFALPASVPSLKSGEIYMVQFLVQLPPTPGTYAGTYQFVGRNMLVEIFTFEFTVSPDGETQVQ
jgi:hypothetical protein